MNAKRITLPGAGVCKDCFATLNFKDCYLLGRKLRTDGGCATNVICERCYRARLRAELDRLEGKTAR